MSGLRGVVIGAMAAHEPTADDCDPAGLVCSNPQHLASATEAAVLAWVAERLDGVREAVARVLGLVEPGADWPTNEALGGGPTGTRDDEYRAAMLNDADAALDAVREALGLGLGERGEA